jgi:hypothetical protein
MGHASLASNDHYWFSSFVVLNHFNFISTWITWHGHLLAQLARDFVWLLTKHELQSSRRCRKPGASQWLTPVIPAVWQVKIRRIMVQSQPWQILCETCILQITRAKWTGAMGQALEHLLCKFEALTSHPRYTRDRCSKHVWGCCQQQCSTVNFL